MMCSGSFVECTTGARFRGTVLNEVILSLSGSGFLLTLWPS